MRIADVVRACGFEAVYLPDPDAEVENAYTSDLLSDVIAHCPDSSLLVSVQNHKNTIAVCTLVCAVGVVIAHNRPIPDDMLESARQEKIAILLTEDDQFVISCKLGKALGAACA